MLGVAVLFAGSLPWGVVLAPLNLRIGVSVPWAALPMAVYLWAYWRFIRGGWGSAESAATRREYLRPMRFRATYGRRRSSPGSLASERFSR